MILHGEGLAVLALSVYFYSYNQFNWWLFILLLFAPDLSMVGYLLNSKIGAWIYNLFHTYMFSIAILLLAIVLVNQTLLAIALIWSAHIGLDRVLGFGLKYPTEFKDTHLNRV